MARADRQGRGAREHVGHGVHYNTRCRGGRARVAPSALRGPRASSVLLGPIDLPCRPRSPRVASLLVHGDRRRRKAGICECPDGDRGRVLHVARGPEDGGAAGRTEVERDASALVTDALPLRGVTRHRYLILAEASLDTERAPGALLALEAMADGDPLRFSFARHRELPARALRDSHGLPKLSPKAEERCPSILCWTQARRVPLLAS
jgi:hypothetical protein